MPPVATGAQARDPAADRLELGLAAAPEAEEHRRGLVTTGDLASDLRAIVRTEDAVGHPRPPLDRPHSLDVDAHLAKPGDRDQEQLVAVRHAETHTRGLCRACQRGLAVQAEPDRHRCRRNGEDGAEHLAESQPADGEATRHFVVLVPLEPLALGRVERRERLRHEAGGAAQRRAAHQHVAPAQQRGERGVRPDGEADP